MEPTQAIPVKKRRRRLIVAFVLLLVSLVSWWYWPRGDARFLGKWQIYQGSASGGGLALNGDLWLSANGMAHFTDKTPPETQSFRWHATSDEYVIGNNSNPIVAAIAQAVSQFVFRLTSHRVFYGDGESRFAIVSCSKVEIKLQAGDTVLVLRRVDQ